VIRRALGRMLLVVAGLLVGLVAVELALQVAAAVHARRAPGATPRAGDRLRILALGDSYTYGLGVEPGEAYPAAFQAVWNARPGAPPVEVLALGYPGRNSAAVRRDLARLLAVSAPDVVLVMVGADDWWTEPAVLDDEDATPLVRVRRWLATHVRLYRLAFMLGRSVEDARPQLSEPGSTADGGSGTLRYGPELFDLGWRAAPPGSTHGWETRLVENLTAIVATVRAADAAPVLVTYPSTAPAYVVADGAMRVVARRTGARLVDVEAVLRERCRTPACPMLLYADGRPNPAGHLLTAQVLARDLVGLVR
jgi:hypothetical protein